MRGKVRVRVGVSAIGFCDAGLRLLDHGYAPIPIVPGEKRPALARWTSVPIDVPTVEAWVRQFPGHGVGLRTGQLVGIEIDILDPDLAHQVEAIVRARLGDTLLRVGLWPKRLLLYRTDRPFAKMAAGVIWPFS